MGSNSEGRDAETIALYNRWVMGEPQRELAADADGGQGISQQALSQRFKAIRSQVKAPSFEEYVERETVLLDRIRQNAYKLLKDAADNPAPVTNVKGDPITFWDEATQTERTVWDRSGELAAQKAILDTHDRFVKMLGLSAPSRLEVTGETDRTRTLAVEAAARLSENEE